MSEATVKLKNVRLSFPTLFEAAAFQDGNKKEFSATFLIPKDSPQIAEIKKALMAVATEKWGEDAEKTVNNLFRDDRMCLHDGDRKDYDGYENMFYIRASNQVRPTVIDHKRNPITAADGKIYSGCFVNAIITLWAQDNKFGKRINANLGGVQFFSDGDAFSGGRVSKADEFEEVQSAEGTGDNSAFL